MTRVLAVDDQADILRIISLGLESQGFEVVLATRAEQALEIVARDPALDAAILDINLSEGSEENGSIPDGLALLSRIREASALPVIMLSSTDLESVKVLALNLGADDYMTKPFGPMEVGARIRAILRRRAPKATENEVKLGSLVIDLERREVQRNQARVSLTATEFELLAVLAQARTRVLSRRQLVDEVWGPSHFGDERVVDVHIRHLREKIELVPSKPEVILTVRGVGYKIGQISDH